MKKLFISFRVALFVGAIIAGMVTYLVFSDNANQKSDENSIEQSTGTILSHSSMNESRSVSEEIESGIINSIDGVRTVSISGERKNSKAESLQYNSGINISTINTTESLNKTIDYFNSRLNNFRSKEIAYKSYFTAFELDIEKKIDAYVWASDRNYALTMNGYFAFLFDKSGDSRFVSPFIINLNVLFNDEHREIAFADKSYSEPAIESDFEIALKEVLQDDYNYEIKDFILKNYRKVFELRLGKGENVEFVESMVCKNLELIFNNDFSTYVEIYFRG